jgi:hypothetical protein
MKKLTKRDALFFFAGILAMLVIEALYDWESAKQSFMKGLNDALGKQEQTK